MSAPRRRLSVIALVVCFIVINTIIAIRFYSNNYYRSHAPQFSDKILRYGDWLPQIVGKSLGADNWAEIKLGVTNLVIYLSDNQLRGRAIELAKYAEMLHRQYKDKGLGVTAILFGELPDIKDLHSRSQLTYKIIQDRDGSLGEKLGLLRGGSGVFLFNEGGACQFSTDHVTSYEDLRQLAAIEFLKVDPFEVKDSDDHVIKEGQQLGAWAITDVRTLQRFSDACVPRQSRAT